MATFYNARMSEHGHHHDHGDKHAVHLALVQRLRAQAAEVARLAAGVDEAALATRSCARQMVDEGADVPLRRMETIFGDRFRRMLTEETTIVPYENPDGDERVCRADEAADGRRARGVSRRARGAMPPPRGV